MMASRCAFCLTRYDGPYRGYCKPRCADSDRDYLHSGEHIHANVRADKRAALKAWDAYLDTQRKTCIHLRKAERAPSAKWAWLCGARLCQISRAACIACDQRQARVTVGLDIRNHPHLAQSTMPVEELGLCVRACAGMNGRAK